MTTIHAAFVAGRAYIKSEAAAVAPLRTDDPAVQKAAKQELKLGMIAAHMPTWDNLPDAEAYAKAHTILSKSGKQRDKEEAAAENRARTALSRLFAKYGIKNLEARGGSEAAKKKPKAPAPAADGWVAGKQQPVPMAAYVRPTIAKPEELASHAAFVAKELGLTLKAAETILTAKQIEAYRKAIGQFAGAISKITKLS